MRRLAGVALVLRRGIDVCGGTSESPTPMQRRSLKVPVTQPRVYEQVLIASSGHLRRDTLQALAVEDFGGRIFKPDRRYLIPLRNTDVPGSQPADLQQITDNARNRGCTWISIDHLASLNTDLPSYG